MQQKTMNLVLMSTSHGMNHIFQLLVPIIIPKIKEDYGLSTTSAVLLISIFSLSYALAQTPSGILSKTLGRKKMLVLGFMITSISFLFMGFIDGIWPMAMIALIAGIGGSTYHPNGMPLLSEFYQENRGQAAGFHQTGGSFGSIIAPLIIGPLVVFFNWRLAIIVLSVLGLVLSGILWLLLKEAKLDSTMPSPDQKQAKHTSGKTYLASLIFIAAAVTYTLGLRGVDSLATLYFTEGRGITNFLQATFLFSLLKIAGLFSGPFCGRLSDTMGRKKTLILLIIIEAAALFTLTSVPIPYLPIACLAFGFASFGLLAITDAFLADITPTEHMATIFGIHFTTSFITQSIIPPVYGVIVDSTNSYDLGFVGLSLLVLLSIPILLKLKSTTE
ncbi:MAG: MFS transporter [Candidatus Bathyarchaeota archaeon]|nr:MAG: MFS transporter [Candidatus Bathyarchaeota archaeon]